MTDYTLRIPKFICKIGVFSILGLLCFREFITKHANQIGAGFFGFLITSMIGIYTFDRSNTFPMGTPSSFGILVSISMGIFVFLIAEFFKSNNLTIKCEGDEP
jgi:hypothetical protein